mmetsp:Transcript_39128/g.117628  ORF Transcript_39128/g.117628 Transcript_39128/m.117628 type:complete len:202 (+) Transcript_39128:633-1238(+)
MSTSPVSTSKAIMYDLCLHCSVPSTQSSSTDRIASACVSPVPGTKAKVENPWSGSTSLILMSTTVTSEKFSSTNASLFDPFLSSLFSSYISDDTRRGRNTHFFSLSDQRMASLIKYPGLAAPRASRTKLNCLTQSTRRISPRAFRTAIHRLLVLATDPSGLVYSFPMDPRYSSSFLTVAHSHFMPLSVSPSPSVMTKRGTT